MAGDGASQATLQGRIASALPPGTEAITGAEFTKESQDAFQRIIAIFNTFLLTFALIALFVGSFIIYNTFSIIVAGRTRELGLLRAVGATRGQVLRSVLVEAFVVGLLASAIGVLFGIGLAIGLGELLRGLGFAGPETPIVVPPGAVASSLLVGTGITVLAALPPARRAATIAPVAAMRDLDGGPVRLLRARAAAAVGLVTGGMFVAFVGVLRARPALLGYGAFVTVCGLLVLGPFVAPRLASLIGRPLPRLLGIEGRFARENARRSPKRTAATAAALMIAVALVAFVAATASSVKASTADAIGAAVRGQFVISSDGFGPTALPPTILTQVRTLPEVAAAAGFRGTFATIDGQNRLVLASDPAELAKLIEITDVEGSFADLGPSEVAVTAKAAAERGLALGDEVTALFPQGGVQQLRVASIYQTRFPLRGPGWLVDQSLFDANTPPSFHTDSAIYVLLRDTSADGIAAARPALEAIVDTTPGSDLQDLREYQEAQTSQVDRFLLVVYVLLALSLVIATIGVANTLILSVTERTRELGLLRAVGTTRRQVRSSIRWEALLIGLVGTALGLLLGLLGAWGLVRTLRDDGITTFAIAWKQVLLVLELMVVATIAAATYPAWRASRLDVLEAIASE